MPGVHSKGNGALSRAFARAQGGFTLIEVLVVVAILALLIGIGIAVGPGILASGRDTRCKANLKGLANAFLQAASADNGHYPVGGSYQYFTCGTDNKNGVVYIAHQKKGWIGWDSGSAYKTLPKATTYSGIKSSPVNKNWHKSFADGEAALRCVTNGTLWAYTNHSHEMYCCPEHVRQHEEEFGEQRFGVGWSYVMNGYFKCDLKYGETSYDRGGGEFGIARDKLPKANKILLFAEVQALPAEVTGLAERDFSKSAGRWETDCTLQYKGMSNNWKSKGEIIGFNHESGNVIHGNIVFADAHVESIELPDKINSSNLQDLTAWLCKGVDYSYNEKTGKYEKTNNTVQ